MDDAELLGPAGAALAAELEAADDVPTRRDLFLVPDGVAYLAGNSWGCNHVPPGAAVDDVLDAWATSGVDAHERRARSRGCRTTRRCVRPWPRWSAPGPARPS